MRGMNWGFTASPASHVHMTCDHSTSHSWHPIMMAPAIDYIINLASQDQWWSESILCSYNKTLQTGLLLWRTNYYFFLTVLEVRSCRVQTWQRHFWCISLWWKGKKRQEQETELTASSLCITGLIYSWLQSSHDINTSLQAPPLTCPTPTSFTPTESPLFQQAPLPTAPPTTPFLNRPHPN